MAVKLMSKKLVQSLLKDFRAGGYTVVKEYGMYRVFLEATDDEPVLTAMNGNNNYLVRYQDDLIQELK